MGLHVNKSKTFITLTLESFDLIEKGHRFGLDLDLFWSCFGFKLVCFGLGLDLNQVTIYMLTCLILDSFWTCFGVLYGFGSNLDLDRRGPAPSLISHMTTTRDK